jgi:GrxC family glutaredoxin
MKDSLTIYTKNDCVYCDRAKNLLKEKNIQYREVLVDTNDQCVVSELQDKTGMKTFPQIFIGNQVLGGFTQLQELEQKTGLKQFL